MSLKWSVLKYFVRYPAVVVSAKSRLSGHIARIPLEVDEKDLYLKIPVGDSPKKFAEWTASQPRELKLLPVEPLGLLAMADYVSQQQYS